MEEFSRSIMTVSLCPTRSALWYMKPVWLPFDHKREYFILVAYSWLLKAAVEFSLTARVASMLVWGFERNSSFVGFSWVVFHGLFDFLVVLVFCRLWRWLLREWWLLIRLKWPFPVGFRWMFEGLSLGWSWCCANCADKRDAASSQCLWKWLWS